MRVLISAYACEPDRGSEPEAGLQAVLTAASRHEVWVITRENNLASLWALLERHPLRARIHVLGLDAKGPALRVKKRGGLLGLHWYYDLWQRRLAELAVRLDGEVGFDVVHHVTLSACWLRAGVAEVDKPLVWGPVGGGAVPPLGLLPVMGARGAVGDLVRVVSRPIVARLGGARRTADRAAVVLAQNPETARQLRAQQKVILLPNALAAGESLTRTHDWPSDKTGPRQIVTAGRLIGLKGTALAISAMRYVEDGDAVLDVYGDGPQRHRLERYTRKLGLTDRVRFMGAVPRSDLLLALQEASALVHPALHEEAGFVVAEALALGTPVVCLRRGGPPVLVRLWRGVPCRTVQPSTPGVTARLIAAGLDEVIGQKGEPGAGPEVHFSRGLLAAYAHAAAGADRSTDGALPG